MHEIKRHKIHLRFAVLLKGLQSLFTDCFSLIHRWICWSSYSLPYLPHQCISKPLALFALICVYSQSYYYLRPSLFLFMYLHLEHSVISERLSCHWQCGHFKICGRSEQMHFLFLLLLHTMTKTNQICRKYEIRHFSFLLLLCAGWVCSGTGKLWRGNFAGNQI